MAAEDLDVRDDRELDDDDEEEQGRGLETVREHQRAFFRETSAVTASRDEKSTNGSI